MKCKSLLFLPIALFFAGTNAFGQSGDFLTKGRVVTGTPPHALAGATVTYTNLEKRLSWDYSDESGYFPLGRVATNRPVAGSPLLNMPLAGDVLVDLFDMTGRKITTIYNGNLSKGLYNFDLPSGLSGKLARTVYVVRIKAGNNVAYKKFLYTGHSNSLIPTGNIVSYNIGNSTAKKLVSIDTLRVGKTGYKSVKVAIDKYDTDVLDVALDTVDIELLTTTMLNSLSQAEVVGMVCQPDCPGAGVVTSALLGTIFGGGSDGPGNGAGSPTEWANFSTEYQNGAAKTPKKIPLIIGFDVVHGFGKCKGATVIPHNIGLGCTFNPITVEKCHRVAGIESRGCGVNMAWGPCIAVPQNDKWGRVYEGFSESPDLTSAMSRAAVLGFQMSDLSHPWVIGACVKHFAGDGGTAGGTDRGNCTGDDAKLRAIHLPGYSAAVKAGTASVMASFSSWNGVRMHENKALLTDWLKGEQKFDGFINGDWDGHTTGTSSPQNCIIAGLDVPMLGANSPGVLLSLFNGLYGTNKDRVLDAAKRVLRIKYRMDLFNQPIATNAALTAKVGSVEHRAIAREGVRKSLVLLKTTKDLLPLAKTEKVTLVGQHSQDVGLQCGGWTLGWQGKAGNEMPGTTIRQGFERIGGQANISYSDNGSGITSKVAVVCIGETPYAEWNGDKADLTIPGASLITTAKAAGKTVIAVLITGRPMDISSIVDKCDAIVAAWLPGTEGDGIPEVLYGDYEFSGKNSMSWPRSSDQEPINVGDANYNPLFAYDYGLNAKGDTLPKGIYKK
jgi:beta-glucosidase